MKREDLQNPTAEWEILSRDEQKVRDLLGGLKRVEAPKNFEFGVRARIAARENSRPLRGAPVWGIGIAGALLLTIFGTFFIISTLRDSGPADRAIATAEAPSASEAPIQSLQPESKPAPPEQNVADVAEPDTIAETETVAAPRAATISTRPASTRVYRPAPAPKPAGAGGGSFDTAVEGTKPIMPPGFESMSPDGTKPVNKPDRLQMSEILAQMGIETESTGETIRVRSVKENSIAGRSGILAGDVIESVGDAAASPASGINGAMDVRSVTVSRGGKRVRIELKP